MTLNSVLLDQIFLIVSIKFAYIRKSIEEIIWRKNFVFCMIDLQTSALS